MCIRCLWLSRIKKAYRKKALELHPDRNFGKVEETTKLFAGIQSAYEVLSDPQERAWYDSHRDVILRGSDLHATDKAEYSYDIRMTTAEEVTQLMLKFNGRLDMSDSPEGFFGGLREFFEKLAKEEELACKWESLDGVEYPPFGHKDDDYDTVVRIFYASWNGFATRKSYAWKDVYRLADAPDRRIRRLMEKENRRLREDATREYNDAVRSLIAFVKKRDTRYQENVKSEAERQKTLRDAAAAQATRSKAARQVQMEKTEKHIVPVWAQSQPDEAALSSEDESAEEQHFECIVCSKTFKSEKQFEVHEKSKRHLKSLRLLQIDMKEDDAAINSSFGKAESVPQSNRDQANIEEQENPSNAMTEAIPLHSDEATLTKTTKRHENGDLGDEGSSHPETPGNQTQESENPSSDEIDSDYAPREPPAPVELPFRTLETPDPPEISKGSAKLGKAKQKRAKKAAQQADGVDPLVSSHQCATCQAGFPSKTKLFTHIKDLGHAQPVAKPSGKGSKNKK